MDELEALAVFVRAVETGSFSKVAAELGVTQPTVSKQMAQLESHYGATLLQRSPHGLKPTDAGGTLYPQAKRLIEEAAQMRAEVQGGATRVAGTLRVHSAASFGEVFLAPLLIRLRETHPGLAVELTLSDRFVDVVEEGIDVSIRFGPLPPLRLVARRVAMSPQVCLAAPAYLETHGEPPTPDGLLNHECVVNNLLSADNRWRFRGPNGPVTVQVRGGFRSNNVRALRDAALAGMGITIGPLWMYFDDLQAGRLKRVLQRYEAMPVEINALYPHEAHVPQRVKLFVDALESLLLTVPAFTTSPVSLS
ncbi:MAG: LysR family transcriptional regulator [Burkholderiales bacterium]|nr:LysR family transcriptional regulator [Burkholderiales bacterium]